MRQSKLRQYLGLWASVELAPLTLRLGGGEQSTWPSTARTQNLLILHKDVLGCLAFVGVG